jgi:CDP-6-deoxy-D-xylo-4-hexulose-3-dehydrase
MLSLRAHGWTRHLPEGSSIYEKSDDDFYEAYRFILPGYNVRPLELSGAVGIEQLKKLDHFVAARRKNADLWVSLFQDDERFIIQKEHGYSSWYSFTVILNPAFHANRKKILQALADHGIQYRIITGGNFLRHDVIKYCDHEVVAPIESANIAHDFGFFIGNHPRDVRQEIERFYAILDSVAKTGVGSAHSLHF